MNALIIAASLLASVATHPASIGRWQEHTLLTSGNEGGCIGTHDSHVSTTSAIELACVGENCVEPGASPTMASRVACGSSCGCITEPGATRGSTTPVVESACETGSCGIEPFESHADPDAQVRVACVTSDCGIAAEG